MRADTQARDALSIFFRAEKFQRGIKKKKKREKKRW